MKINYRKENGLYFSDSIALQLPCCVLCPTEFRFTSSIRLLYTINIVINGFFKVGTYIF